MALELALLAALFWLIVVRPGETEKFGRLQDDYSGGSEHVTHVDAKVKS